MIPLTASEQALVTEALPLVNRAARVYARRFAGVSEKDLEGAGHEALVRAVRRYDATRGPFRDFAKRAVFGAVLEAAFAARGFRRRTLQAMRSFQHQHAAQSVDAAPEQSLEALISQDEHSIQRNVLDNVRARALSFALVAAAQDTPHLEETFVARETQARTSEALQRALAALAPDEQTVIRGIYWDNCTLAQLADQLSVASKTVQRIAERAKKKIHGELAGGGFERAPAPLDLG